MELTDLIRTGALIVVFLVVALFSDRRVWISTDILATGGFGLALVFFPKVVIDFQVQGDDKLDSLHMFLCRILGVTFLCSVIVWHMTKDTRDGTVTIALMMSRVFSTSVILINQFYSLWGTAHGTNYWNEQFIWFGMVGTGLWFLGNLIHLSRSGDFCTYPQHNIRLNNHLRIDSWFVLLLGIFLIAFPEFFFRHMFGKPGNLIHLYLLREIGAAAVGDAIISLQAPGFLHERDKKAQLCARLVTLVLMSIPWLFGMLVLGTVSLDALCHLLLVLVLPLFNALIGYCTPANVIYKVPKRD